MGGKLPMACYQVFGFCEVNLGSHSGSQVVDIY
jgi:hypothetical protein